MIQCPNGSLNLYDWGSSNGRGDGFWNETRLRGYLNGRIGDIRSIVVTHHHQDHYNLLPGTFLSESELSGLEHIYIACTKNHMSQVLQNWVNAINGNSKLRVFNNGSHCGTNNVSCESLDMCPGYNVVTSVMSANMGGCAGGNKNIESIVTKFTFGGLSILLSGDFEDSIPDENANGPQRQMVDHYGKNLTTQVYHAAHHGATARANKPVWLTGVAPNATVASGDPWFTHRHPRCSVFDRLRDDVGSLCQPGSSCPAGSSTQHNYTCGINNSATESRPGNTHAIYTTTPDQSNLNLIDVASTDSSWTITHTPVAREKSTRKEDKIAR